MLEIMDQYITEYVVSHRTATITQLAKYIGLLGDTEATITCAVLIGLVCLLWGKPKTGLLIVASYGLTFFLKESIKDLIARPRPPLEIQIMYYSGYSMPSGHAMMTGFLFIVVWGILCDFKRKYIVLLLYPLLVGISRIITTVHWPSDVLLGWLLGSLIGLLVVWLYRRLAIIRD